MTLPAPVQSYFDADKAPGGGAPVDAFAANAIVMDEGKTHVGRDAIEAWWHAAKARYQHTAEPYEVLDERGLTLVRASVSGQFPGSPALLTFVFRLEQGQIASLEIGT